MTAKKTARPAAQPAKPDAKSFELRAPAMPRLQAARPEPEGENEMEAEAALLPARLSDKDVILRLVEVLKGL